MKHVISISIGEETLYKLKQRLNSPDFRNKSHLVEKAILEFLRGDIK